MKKRLFLPAILLLQTIACFSQGLVVNNNTIKIDSTQFEYPLVYRAVTPNSEDSSAKPDGSKKTAVWVEAGDGFYTTNPLESYKINGSQTHQPFMIATKLYDTTKNPPSKLSFHNSSLLANTGGTAILSREFLTDPGVKIVSNLLDIVPGDTMAFAIHYKTYRQNEEGGTTPESGDTTFKLYFFYNNNRSFVPLKQNNEEINIGGSNFRTCRIHNSELISYGAGIEKKNLRNGFDDFVCFTLNNTNKSIEKTVFISMVPFADLEFGKSGSVYAVLTDSKDSIIATDMISNMLFAPAHDPNYIVQQPACLKLPKKVYPFNYTVHFQNTGMGPAKEVKVIIHLPKGLDWGTFKIKKVTYAGRDYIKYAKVQPYKSGDSIEVRFLAGAVAAVTRNDGDSVWLLGTAVDPADPFMDPSLTMGEFLFSFSSTPNTDDSLKAYAAIYFKSMFPSSDTTIDGYEKPVITNIATTVYKDCCTCNDPIPLPGCFILWGLCWWWWVIIIIALLIIWWLIARRRKEKARQSPPPADNRY